jgi:hypothetical protein
MFRRMLDRVFIVYVFPRPPIPKNAHVDHDDMIKMLNCIHGTSPSNNVTSR